MRLDLQFSQKLSITVSCLNENRTITFNTPYGQGTMAQDYRCWLNNAIIADYTTIVFLLQSMPDINQFDLRPIHCILRSTLEKYADVLNFYSYGDNYYEYLSYLNKTSEIRFVSKNNNKYSELKDEISKHCENVAKIFNTKICDRKTRYFLLSQFNSNFKHNMPQIIVFNQRLVELDSRLSQILHNNAETLVMNNVEKTVEILKNIVYMMYTSQCIFANSYNLNMNPVITQCINSLAQILNDIDNQYINIIQLW